MPLYFRHRRVSCTHATSGHTPTHACTWLTTSHRRTRAYTASHRTLHYFADIISASSHQSIFIMTTTPSKPTAASQGAAAARTADHPSAIATGKDANAPGPHTVPMHATAQAQPGIDTSAAEPHSSSKVPGTVQPAAPVTPPPRDEAAHPVAPTPPPTWQGVGEPPQHAAAWPTSEHAGRAAMAEPRGTPPPATPTAAAAGAGTAASEPDSTPTTTRIASTRCFEFSQTQGRCDVTFGVSEAARQRGWPKEDEQVLRALPKAQLA